MPLLRVLSAHEVARAYAVYLGVFAWLSGKGIRQWLVPFPAAEFVSRQGKGELFGYFVDEALAAVTTLAMEAPGEWSAEFGTAPRWWLKSLAVDRSFSHRALGAAVVRASEATVVSSGGSALWLDCVDVSFLPRYYARCGYRVHAAKPITYPSGNSFPMILMVRELAEGRECRQPTDA